jgi:hypothetical protein
LAFAEEGFICLKLTQSRALLDCGGQPVDAGHEFA